MPELRDRDVQDPRKIKRTDPQERSTPIESSGLLSIIDTAARDKKAENVVTLDMRKTSDICDYFFICSATSSKHAQAVADGIIEALDKKKVKVWHKEGYQEGRWILLDVNAVIAHIFAQDAREFYRLERLWGGAVQVKAVRQAKKILPKRKKWKKTSSKKKSPA